MAYYNQENYPEYISYSLGAQKHIIEKEIEELANEKRLKSIIYFLFLIESFDMNEVVITAYIICQINDNCALNYIKDLFNLYSKQKNPINKFNSLHTKSDVILSLTCYDYETKQIKECLLNEYSTCITNLYQQGCSSDQNMKLEYVFMITLSEQNFLKKVHELIICNTNNCNEKFLIEKIENIIYNYTFGSTILLNNGNKKNFHLFIFTIYFILMFKFFLMIFKMIF
jgi:hypothetical protein